MATLKGLFISSKGLRHKLMVAFSLMTIIPLLACVYLLSPYLNPGFQNLVNLAVIILASLVISILGLIIAGSIINAVVELSAETKKISAGDYDRRIDIPGDDELGNLGQSINMMTRRIKSNLDELKNYGQSMKAINAEIQKKVTALSSLLQIDEVISAGSLQIDSLLELGVGKASGMFDMGFGALYMSREEDGDFIAKVCYNADKEKLAEIVIRRGGHGVLEKAIENKKMFQVTDGMKLPDDLDDFKRAHNLKNFIVIPLYSDRIAFGLLLLGNRLSDFSYTSDDIELATVFAKHITIAIESDLLEKKNKELAIMDDLTGLYNKRYLLIRLEEEIKRSIFYQRPCAFIVFRVDNFRAFRETNGELASEEALKRIAKVIRDNNIPVGRAARIGGSEFAMLLPEKNKKEATRIAEDVRRKIENVNVLKAGKVSLEVKMGLSENPIDGATSEELFKKAVASLEKE
ncbi:MAG: diguanylate cyclase [Candidatus Omnitrophica bacterium]|nr:diguanylate cyclase [Candidatus Omnitrophota bacterium]